MQATLAQLTFMPWYLQTGAQMHWNLCYSVSKNLVNGEMYASWRHHSASGEEVVRSLIMAVPLPSLERLAPAVLAVTLPR